MKKPLLFFPAVLFFIHFSYSQQDSTQFYKASDGTRIYFEQKGQGYPVVLVHGFTNTGDSWKHAALYDTLLGDGYRVITVDLRGNGRSGKPHDESYYAHDAEARDIMGILDQLGVDKYDVIGYSRGSIITARLLVLDPRVRKAVLGGMGDDFTNPMWPRRVLFYHVLAGDTTVPELQGLLNRIEKEGMDRQALALSQKQQPSTSREALSHLKNPVLVICGDEDEDNGSAKKLAEIIPGAKYRTVPGKHGGTNNTIPFAHEIMLFLKS